MLTIFLLLSPIISAHWCVKKLDGVDHGREVCEPLTRVCSSLTFHFESGIFRREGCDVTQDCDHGIRAFTRDIDKDVFERRIKKTWPNSQGMTVLVKGNCTSASPGHNPWASTNAGARDGFAIIMILLFWMAFHYYDLFHITGGNMESP